MSVPPPLLRSRGLLRRRRTDPLDPANGRQRRSDVITLLTAALEGATACKPPRYRWADPINDPAALHARLLGHTACAAMCAATALKHHPRHPADAQGFVDQAEDALLRALAVLQMARVGC